MPTQKKGETEHDFPPGLGQPALRALAAAGYTRLDQLASVKKADLLRLHGMGPKALGLLREALDARGLAFHGGEEDHPATVDEYIAGFPENVQQILVKIKAVIKEAAPEATEKISYNMPAFFLNGGLVWFGAYKRHIGFYPLTEEMEASIEELAAYKGTKSSIHFPLNKPIPYELIAKMVRFRVTENQKDRAAPSYH